MHIIKAMIIAFSTYSKIPMPQFEWKEEDMRYSMCFFPWVGAVIGALVFAWYRIAQKLGFHEWTYVCIATAIPLLVTGGFHVDAAVTTGAQALQYANSLDGGILVCSPRFVDMMYTELHEYIPATFQMLLVASPDICNEHEVADIMCLSICLLYTSDAADD